MRVSVVHVSHAQPSRPQRPSPPITHTHKTARRQTTATLHRAQTHPTHTHLSETHILRAVVVLCSESRQRDRMPPPTTTPVGRQRHTRGTTPTTTNTHDPRWANALPTTWKRGRRRPVTAAEHRECRTATHSTARAYNTPHHTHTHPQWRHRWGSGRRSPPSAPRAEPPA